MDIHSLKYGPLIDGKVQTLKEGFYKWMDGMERKMMISSLHTDIHNGYIKLYEQKTQKLDIFSCVISLSRQNDFEHSNTIF